MTQAELEKRYERGIRETLIIKKTNDGYRVYAPGNPGRNYLVSDESDGRVCTCPDFERHRDDPDWRCKHVLAVDNHLGRLNGAARRDDALVDAEERRAIHEEGREHTVDPFPTHTGGPSKMVLKRSASPDGRIDSLSVEFTCTVDGTPSPEVKRRACRVLDVQSEIVEDFLAHGMSGNVKRSYLARPGNGDRSRGDRDSNGAVEARLVRVGGMNTRYGRRLFINVQVDGDVLKLFGSKKALAEAIEAAGFPSQVERIEEGLNLDLPCRVTTKPSDDGRYTNVDQVLPAGLRGSEGRLHR